MTVIIAGERSGVGKTTITLALLAGLERRGLRVQSFKVGPDYIDPMFHTAVTQRPCRTLDPVLTSEAYVQDCVARHLADCSYGLIEGVMGLFDGALGDRDWASTAQIAKLLNLPVVLVIDCGKLSRSVAALVHGYRTFDPELTLAGVILNHVSSHRHQELLKQALAPLGVPILGILGRHEPVQIPDRYLGLVPTEELQQFAAIQSQLADLGDRCLDWLQLLPLLKTNPCPVKISPPPKAAKGHVRIAIARDSAFNFYYPENLEALQAAGAELIFWSPLSDPLPDQIHGLVFGGGFPELFAAPLAANQLARSGVLAAIRRGVPTYAECGGLMYLCHALTPFEGESFPMVGAIPNEVQMQKKLSLGYRQIQPTAQAWLVQPGDTLIGHEFHHSQMLIQHSQPLYQVWSVSQPYLESWGEGWGDANLQASYVHLHWGAHPEIAARFVHRCCQWRDSRD
ncbi:cobyrinate a,c-diamide synthase [Lyngbya confervoides]|uniref:Cobyrinate a,c-diamide synthase n=1 Tax=Lyngbya confervoides BDU141951 TaxID=1574623 RepID=A0ABD4T698_9CYAN|nr:cobyrinate a,c-diamide synthase [Lyngbya confervoides]MCM1984151.1 cobyrinate a,c-diamide synthase [Lyngbya confervoides BDU141951]